MEANFSSDTEEREGISSSPRSFGAVFFSLLVAPINSLMRSLEAIHARSYILDDTSPEMITWDWLLGGLSVFTTVYSPLALTFSSIR